VYVLFQCLGGEVELREKGERESVLDWDSIMGAGTHSSDGCRVDNISHMKLMSTERTATDQP
jgi:hypothetical protein